MHTSNKNTIIFPFLYVITLLHWRAKKKSPISFVPLGYKIQKLVSQKRPFLSVSTWLLENLLHHIKHRWHCINLKGVIFKQFIIQKNKKAFDFLNFSVWKFCNAVINSYLLINTSVLHIFHITLVIKLTRWQN